MDSQTSRRTFLSEAASGSAAGVFSFTIVPRSVFGSEERPAPSDRNNFGHIGIGGRGRGFVRPPWRG